MTLTPHERAGVILAPLGELTAPTLEEVRHLKSVSGKYEAVIWAVDTTEGRSPFIYEIRRGEKVIKRAVHTQHLEQLENELVGTLRRWG